jgi:uncharacterized membrane protein YkoI
MTGRLLLALTLAAVANRSEAQTRVRVSGGDVSRSAARGDPSRLGPVPGIDADLRARLRVGGDSAQRIALNDFEWRGHVTSIEIDEEDARLYWDVKIVPDSGTGTIVRYRVDATNGGILSIKEFTGIKGLRIRKPD